jgi:formate dehydrogenase subunit beta
VIIPLKNENLTETFNRFFRDLLKKKIVDALIIPQSVLSGNSFAHTLVKDPSQIKNAYPFVPFLTSNGAKAVSLLTAWDPSQKLGVVLRSCEIRTLIELVKFKQASMDQIFLIGVDCLGTVESADFEKMNEKGKPFNIQKFLSGILTGQTVGLRKACQVCPYPVLKNVHMHIGFIGMNIKKEIYFHASDEIAAQLDIKNEGDTAGRDKNVANIIAARKKQRKQFFLELKKRFKSISDLLNEFARCRRCYNCRAECPICFCKECIFLTNIFNHKPDQYLRWAERKGSIKLPYDTLLFHLTRLNHMVTSCVGCGVCSSACPNGLPVFELFQYMGRDVRVLFDYVPGESIEDEPPLNRFKEKELEPK